MGSEMCIRDRSYKDWLKKIYDYEKDMPEIQDNFIEENFQDYITAMMSANLYELCLLYTSPSPRDGLLSRMPSSA